MTMAYQGQRLDMQTPLKYGSHLPVLMAVVHKTKGDILELGSGLFSTPYLHGISVLTKRQVLTLDNDSRWLDYFRHYQSPNHTLTHATNWDKAPIDKVWDLALVDHAPASRRIVDIKRLAHLAKYIIIHDSNGRYEQDYHYSRIYPLFKYKFDFIAAHPSTTVLSNLASLKKLL